MIEVLFTGIGFEDAALTIARVGTGAFFAISGFHKLFNKARHTTLVETLKGDHIPAVGFNQWFVPSVELSAGLGVAFGLLAPLAALGLLVICFVATCSDGVKRIRDWQPIDKADVVDDYLYLPEVLYIGLLLFIISHGAGPYSLDALVHGFLF